MQIQLVDLFTTSVIKMMTLHSKPKRPYNPRGRHEGHNDQIQNSESKAVLRCGGHQSLLCGRSCNSISLIYGPLCALSVRSEKHQLRKWSFAASAFQISKFLKAGAQTRCEGNKYENLRHSSRKKVSFYARAGVLPPRLRLGLVYFFCVPDFFRLNI